MVNTDSIHVVSQAKSGFQLICGDAKGAAKTQENFFRECPGVSQVTSTVQLLTGDPEGALETQKRCGKAMLNMLDGVPAVGQLKDVIHYAVGDKEGGNRAMKSATRTTGVLLGGAGGFIVGGPVRVVAGGVYGGATVDTVTTIADSEIHGEFRPSGYLAGINNAINNPNPGDIFDLALMPVADGLAGYGAGKMIKRVQNSAVNKSDLAKANALEAQAQAILDAAEAEKMTMTDMEYINEANKATKLYNQAQQLKGKPNVPTNLKQGTASTSTSSSTSTVQVGAIATTSGRQNQQQSDDERTRSFADKLKKINELIKDKNRNIVAFVESWLRENHRNVDIFERLGLQGYQIFRQDRGSANIDNAYGDYDNYDLGRRGGEILVAFRCVDARISFERNLAEDYHDNVMNFDIKYKFDCRKCNRQSLPLIFGFVAVYRRPGPYGDQDTTHFESIDDEIIDRMAHLSYYYPDNDYDGFAMVGDYNWGIENSRLHYVRSYQNGLSDLSRNATHIRGNALDHVIHYRPGFTGTVQVTEPISDHSALIFQLNLGKDVRSGERCDYCQT